MRAFPPESIAPGKWHVTDEEVRNHLGQCKGTRYRTVCETWIRRLQNDHGITIYRRRVTGFYCPQPREVLANTQPQLESAGRKLRKQMRRVHCVKPEDEAQRQEREHQGRLLHVMNRELRKTRLNLLPSRASAPLPQVLPPKQIETVTSAC